jgi:hypothetical protein
MTSNDDILARLNALEEENRRLRAQAAGTSQPKETTTHVTMWKGHPVIRFEGAFKPFSLGLKKASIVLEKLDDVRFFVQNNRQHLEGAPDADRMPPKSN